MSENFKVSIIGTGAVGATTGYALAISGIARDLVMVDIDKERAEGEVLDIIHGSAFLDTIDITAGNYEDTANSDIVVITAGFPSIPGETRLQLVDRNIEIFKEIIPEVVKYSPESIILVVTNPVDILTRVTLELSGFEPNRVIGSGTVLDSSRLRNGIGRHFGVNVNDVQAMIIGEHGDSGFPVWSLANINGIPLEEYGKLTDLEFDNKIKNKIAKDVVYAGYVLIDKKGSTYYAIGLSVTSIVTAILKDSKSVMPVGALINDYYEAYDIYLGLPCVLGRNGIEKVLKIELNEDEIIKFNESAKTLMDIFENSYKRKE